MMLDDIKKIFEDEKLSKAYKRINSIHPIDIYLGYNEAEEKSLVIIEQSKCRIVASTKIINTNIGKREDGKIKLEFALTDVVFDEMFFKFCEDIIISSLNEKKQRAVEHIINRWNAWRVMFQNASIDRLSDQVLQGLIGELEFIKNKMIPQYGYKKAIVAWDGPMGGHKDFVIEDTWFEVKTCSLSSDTVKISSLEQLDAEQEGNLEIIRLEKVNYECNDAISLNVLVEDVKKQILDVDILKLYYEKLSKIGYHYNTVYDSMTFIIGDKKTYVVNNKFPRIRRKDVPKQIQSIQYDLRISNL